MKNLGEFDAGVDRGHSCARCCRCQVILDENNCAEPTDTSICDFCRLEEWVRGKGQAKPKGGGDAADKDRSFGWVNAAHGATNVRWTLGMPRRLMGTRTGFGSYIISDVMSSSDLSGDTPGRLSHHGPLG